MAKRRPVTAAPSVDRGWQPSIAPTRWARHLAITLLAGVMVYVVYHPSDSVAVERGDGLWFAMLAILIATLNQIGGNQTLRVSFLDAAVWMMSGWVMLAAFATSDVGNLRSATNEAWVWIAGAAIFTSCRRMLVELESRQAILALAIAIATGSAVHGLHQQWISLPQNRAAYRHDPDRVIGMAGIDAPEGTSERMSFENRLFDGGPAASFALANSWAAILLVGIVISGGVLRVGRARLSLSLQLAMFGFLVACFLALIAARSRSAMLAMMIALGWLCLTPNGARKKTLRTVLRVLAAMLCISLIIVGLLAAIGNREWFDAAPASLAFRFQYWRSTWQMFLDRPWFGAGPGNFQSIYEQYREASATEQVSDPHNFFFETLASGGWVAATLLVIAIIAGARFVFAKSNVETDQARSVGNELSSDGPTIHHCVAWGAGISLGLVWLFGWITRQLPDIEANLFAIPIAVAVAVMSWRAVKALSDGHTIAIAMSMLVGLMIHLCVAGGWTVPGVAIWVWIAAAVVTRNSLGDCEHVRSVAYWWKVGWRAALMAALYFISLRPVEQQRRWMAAAELAQTSGQVGKARTCLERAVAADPWDVTALLWLADFYRWSFVADPNNSDARKQWSDLLAEVTSRGGEDPSVYRQVGISQVHLYQRYGNSDDLVEASKSFAEMVRLSPANQWAMAQSAVIEAALGNDRVSEELAGRAKALSLAGANPERALSLQSVYVAQKIGNGAIGEPIRKPADELLRLQ